MSGRKKTRAHESVESNKIVRSSANLKSSELVKSSMMIMMMMNDGDDDDDARDGRSSATIWCFGLSAAAVATAIAVSQIEVSQYAAIWCCC